MDSISFEAEVFFTRLIMKADDYGSYYSNPKLLKAALFPLKEVSFQQIGQWVFECTEAGLIFPYEVEGKEYIRIHNFKQRLRNMRNSFPHPLADNSPQVAANSLTTRRESPPETKRNEVETETETEPAAAILYVKSKNVPREPLYNTDDFYQTPSQAFEEIKNDEQFVESLLRVARGEGYVTYNAMTVVSAVRSFITVEGAKPEFKDRPRADLRKHLVNWIRSKAKTLNQYERAG